MRARSCSVADAGEIETVGRVPFSSISGLSCVKPRRFHKRHVQELLVARSSSMVRLDPVDALQPGAACWKLSKSNWIRLNVDGAVNLHTGAAAAGGVIGRIGESGCMALLEV
ncbi:hypothetical protein V6N13_041383 [Hibiscus sabdariffa]